MSQIFNDGVTTIYSVENIAQPGNMPKEGLIYKVGPLRYRERTVGMGRFWTAMQAQVKIDQVIRVQQIRSISTQDVVVLVDGKQYRIKQIQYPEDIKPPVMDLSLERLEAEYEFG